MSELTLLLLRIGFLVLLWAFVFAVVYSLRADLFGVKVRRMPDAAAAAAGPAASVPVAGAAATAPVAAAPSAAPSQPGGLATTAAVSRIVITSGPKAGLELPLGNEPLTIGRSSESGLVVRDDYTSSHHARRSRSAARASRDSSSATTTRRVTTRASCSGATSG
ncbi:MAG: fhaB [Microbacterium sp.]|nr:fhaB [Microbacterium sp.]